ncbi:putative branched-chain-amino-acid aminotransferase [Holospora obtusa F1]|uniref:Probable branched-chain-amino-acid aminotransferase n=1 Tax=Holospora obtusa F1 TaxID=1399147 RepID=W6TDF5_HOLOB|nr:aminotransferase class IV [Holospora obtusa]ETZ06781.1 putative branched-chain-amino-acid aminotransferase [Holospora obtusa F1]
MFDQLEGNIWLDGAILAWNQAKIHIMTHALHYGTSVYEGIRSRNGVLFRGFLHYQRFLESANLLDFQIPYSVCQLVQATQLLLDATHYHFGYVRALAWCGSQSMFVSHRQSNVHTAIMIWERPMPYSTKHYEKGLHLHISSWRRPDPRSAPVHSKASGLYMISAMAKRTAELKGFDDAVLLDTQDRIAEASSSNIFFVKDGKLLTPFPHSFLKGLTRAFVIEQAKKRGIDVQETDIFLSDLPLMDSAFLTGTAVGIVPIASILSDSKVYKFYPDTVTRNLQLIHKETFDLL